MTTKKILFGCALVGTLSMQASAAQYVHLPNAVYRETNDSPGEYLDLDCLLASRDDVTQQNPDIKKKAVRALFGKRGQTLRICQITQDPLDVSIQILKGDGLLSAHSFGWWMDELPNIRKKQVRYSICAA
jgi:hypothetical protein